MVLLISSVSPSFGWAGTILEILGSDFAPERDGNQVDISGTVALVLEAASHRLLVQAGAGTTTGPVTVTVDGHSAVAPDPFTVQDPVDGGQLGHDGPPAFFTGPQGGSSPRAGVNDQKVLAVLCYPVDHDPAGASAALASAEKATVAQANRYWREASYGSTSWYFDFTDY